MPAGTHIINAGTGGKQLYTMVSTAGAVAGLRGDLLSQGILIMYLLLSSFIHSFRPFL